MNIVLAEVQSLNINRSESVVESDAEANEFSNLIKSSLTDKPADSEQALENKELITNSFDLQAIETTKPLSWGAYLATAKLTVTTDSEPAATTIPGGDRMLQNNTIQIDSGNILRKTVVGVQLPVDGKVLPQNRESIGKLSLPGSRRLSQQAEIPVIPLAELSGETNSRENQRVGLMRGDGRQLMQASDQNSSIHSDKLVDIVPGKILDFQTAQYSQLDSAIARPIGITPTATQTGLQTNLPLPTQLELLNIVRPDSAVEWSRGIGDRVSWMINQKMNTAAIRLDPPSLGKLEIHIQVSDEVTNITINAQNAHTRELIDNASIRLRDALQEAGYQNVNVDVGHDRNQPRSGSQQSADMTTDNGDYSDGQHELNSDMGSETANFYKSDSLVDYFV